MHKHIIVRLVAYYVGVILLFTLLFYAFPVLGSTTRRSAPGRAEGRNWNSSSVRRPNRPRCQPPGRPSGWSPIARFPSRSRWLPPCLWRCPSRGLPVDQAEATVQPDVRADADRRADRDHAGRVPGQGQPGPRVQSRRHRGGRTVSDDARRAAGRGVPVPRIGTGLAAGVQLLFVALVASMLFNAVTLVIWRLNIGAQPAVLAGWRLVEARRYRRSRLPAASP